jgi:hypothetical protein
MTLRLVSLNAGASNAFNADAAPDMQRSIAMTVLFVANIPLS